MMGHWGARSLCIGALLVAGVAHGQQDTVTYVYTDPQGTPLAEADAKGNITATFDYTPYGTTALGTPPNGPGYTGHVNDPETDLTYMQARYYDPATGHFLSVDHAPPKAGDLNYFNRYAYVGNNPILRTDPTGDYLCGGSSAQCQTVSSALKDITRMAGKLPSGSQGQQVLNKIVTFYGKEGVDNNVNVAFGMANGNNSITETKGSGDKAITTITFNLANIRLTGSNPGTSPRWELDGAVAHEGQNGITGRFFGQPINSAEMLVTETAGFRAQSYVYEAANLTSPYGLWKNGWRETPETNAQREAVVKALATKVAYPNGQP